MGLFRLHLPLHRRLHRGRDRSPLARGALREPLLPRDVPVGHPGVGPVGTGVRVDDVDDVTAPVLNVDVCRPRPHTPPPAATPSRSLVATTLVPAGQYCAGRQCSWVALYQCQAPRTGGAVAIVRRSSIAVCAAGATARFRWT